jgi:hypothetical protein
MSRNGVNVGADSKIVAIFAGLRLLGARKWRIVNDSANPAMHCEDCHVV